MISRVLVYGETHTVQTRESDTSERVFSACNSQTRRWHGLMLCCHGLLEISIWQNILNETGNTRTKQQFRAFARICPLIFNRFSQVNNGNHGSLDIPHPVISSLRNAGRSACEVHILLSGLDRFEWNSPVPSLCLGDLEFLHADGRTILFFHSVPHMLQQTFDTFWRQSRQTVKLLWARVRFKN
jgi:hypothetical protein